MGAAMVRLTAIKTATPLTSDVSAILPHQLLAQTLAQQLRVLLAAIEHVDTQIAAFAQPLPDYALFQALPGAGPAYAPRLLAAFGEQRERYLDSLKRRGSLLLDSLRGLQTYLTVGLRAWVSLTVKTNDSGQSW